MQMLFKQRLFSWFDSYDIYDESGATLYTVRGRMSWGHKLEIYDAYGQHIGTVKEEIFRLLPQFSMYVKNQYMGRIKKEFTFFKPVFTLDCNGWVVAGDYWHWQYYVNDPSGRHIMHASKQLLRMTDTYVIDVPEPANALCCLMIVLAIDAAKCSGKS